MPHGTISPKWDRSVLTLSAKPWLVTQREIRTPIAASFSIADPDAGQAGDTGGGDAELRDRLDQDLFEIAHVAVHVAAILRQLEDRIADQLPGAVIRDVAAAAGLEQPDALARQRFGRFEDVRARRCGSARRA